MSAEPLPSACILIFWLSWDQSERGVGAFPPANGSALVRLRVDKTQRVDAIQMGESYRCERSGEVKDR